MSRRLVASIITVLSVAACSLGTATEQESSSSAADQTCGANAHVMTAQQTCIANGNFQLPYGYGATYVSLAAPSSCIGTDTIVCTYGFASGYCTWSETTTTNPQCLSGTAPDCVPPAQAPTTSLKYTQALPTLSKACVQAKDQTQEQFQAQMDHSGRSFRRPQNSVMRVEFGAPLPAPLLPLLLVTP
jgi:hypothetical protein